MSTESSYPSKLRVLNRRATWPCWRHGTPAAMGSWNPRGWHCKVRITPPSCRSTVHAGSAAAAGFRGLAGKTSGALFAGVVSKHRSALPWPPGTLVAAFAGIQQASRRDSALPWPRAWHGLGAICPPRRPGGGVQPIAFTVGIGAAELRLAQIAARFLHASPIGLPFDSASIDVACLVGLLETAPDPQAVVDEIYRVLKPGGKVLTLTPACYDVDYWQRMLFWWNRFFPRPAPAAWDRIAVFGAFAEAHVWAFRRTSHSQTSSAPGGCAACLAWLPMPMLERTLDEF